MERRQFIKLGSMAVTAGLVNPPFLPGGEDKGVGKFAGTINFRLHLDGARLFNVPHHSGKRIEEYTALFDTVYISLWKCFNAASGAMLAGSKQSAEGLFHIRRMFGGSLPQAWPLIAVAVQYAENYLAAYASAWKTADGFLSVLQKDDRFRPEKIINGTSIFKMRITGVDSEKFLQRLREQNIILSHPDKNAGVFWMTVNTTLNRVSPEELANSFVLSAGA